MRFAISLAAIAVLAACGSKKSDDSGKDKAKPAVPKDKTDIPPKAIALEAGQLKPVIHALGPDRSVPSSIVIELAMPVVDQENMGESAQTKFTITPEIAGSLVFTGVSELTFTPAQPFDLGTTYKVEIAAIETRDGALEKPAGENWSYEFKTPAFAFLGWAPTQVDFKAQTITMDLAFSGQVLPTAVVSAMTITIDGQKPAGVMMLPNNVVPNVVSIQIHDAKVAAGHKLSLAMASLDSLAGGKISNVKSDFIISNDKAVSIKTANAVEGASGFYVEVVCNDEGAPKGNRGYYDRGSYQGLSQRCQLNDASMDHIKFDPPVAKAYITPGRAGFRIFGDFKRGAYGMKIDAGAMSVDGGVVLAPFSTSFAVSARKPLLQFAGTGRYLPRTAWTNLGIKHLNVDQVNLVVRRIPPENLIFWLSGNRDTADDRTSDLILEKTIQVRGKADVEDTTWLDVASLLPATTKGVLEMKLVAIGSRATARLLLTNISLVAKKTSVPGKPWQQQVKVWALDMDTAATESGVDVQLVRKSGKIVAKCETKGNDGCMLDTTTSDDPDQSEPFAVIAHKGDDLTYIRYQDLRADVADSSTSGIPYSAESPYHTAIYADRGVYRPGDTAHVVAIVRDAKDKAPDTTLPVDVKVIDPKAKIVRKLVLKTNPSGVIALDQTFAAFADTGHYRVEFNVADRSLGAYDVQVEEFVPERMKVTATPKQDNVLVGDKVAFDVNARYLFGGSAGDSGVTVDCQLAPTQFAPKDNADFMYGVPARGKRIDMAESRDQLDPQGNIAIACGDSPTSLKGTAELDATVSVLEAGSGRATIGHASVTVHPEKFYIGMRTKAQHATTGEAFTVEGRIVDWNGKVLPKAMTKLDLQFLHYESDYGYQGAGDDDEEQRYDRYVRPVPEGKRTVDVVNGEFTLEVKPGEAGAGYVVRAVSGKAKTDLTIDGDYSYEYYDYGEYGYGDQSPRPQRPTQLKLQMAKEIVTSTPIEVKVKTPYHGKLLWTVETDHVLKSEWVDASGADATWSFTLDEFAPTVYVSAFLVKDPHLESKDAFLPDRAYGVGSARVTPTAFTEAVTVQAPKEVRSSSPLSVNIDVGPSAGPTVATIAVVDEGILSLTGFPTPDPLKQLFAKRGLGVETYETLGWTMLHQAGGKTSNAGGGGDETAGDSPDGGGALKKDRVQPTKPMALFSGIVAVGADGKATVPFQIPMYRGKVRVMVVTASATRVGRAETDVIVRDPLVVQTTFPRFATQKDQLQIPVFLTNVSGGPLDVDVALSSETIAIAGLAPAKTGQPLTFAGKGTGHVKLEDGHSETLVFAVTAAQAIGGGTLKVAAHATGPKGTFDVKDQVDVPFLAPGPKERTITKMKVAAGTLDLHAKLAGWVPLTEESSFWLTNNPYAEAFAHMSYLVHYPYGCIEQTTSSTRPLIYAAALATEVDPRLQNAKIEDMVVAGISRVLSMETPSGGFGYWPGATQPLEWATAYATHMLLDAKKAGYAVPEDRLKEVLAWIEGRVAAYENGERIAHEPWNHYDEQSEAYLHYVLALAGKGKKARMLQIVSEIKKGSTGELAEDRYMLEAGLYLAGDRRFEADLKNPDTSPIAMDRINSWSFYSDRRKRGFELDTFFDLFGANPAGELLATRVSEGLTGQYSGYYNTQELVWGLSGLGKWVTANKASGTAGGQLMADGAEIKPRAQKTKSTSLTWSVVRASEYGKLTLEVPASAAGMWLVTTTDGVRTGSDYKVGGNGMTIERTYHALDGSLVDPSKDPLHLGDLLTVEVDVANTTGVAIQNVAVVDRLPGAFEIENPHLGRGTLPAWVKPEQLWTPDFANMRDDHFEAFGTLYPNQPRKLIYTVRVVTAGTFTIPPVDVEAMYDASLWARAKASTAVVAGPWTGKTL